MSRDDMFSSGHSQPPNGLHPSRISFDSRPSRLTTPDGSRSITPLPFPTAARMPSPESWGSSKTHIGAALGSASNAPTSFPNWQQMIAPALQPGFVPEPMFAKEAPIQRHKTQRRKLFGGLFGAKKQA